MRFILYLARKKAAQIFPSRAGLLPVGKALVKKSTLVSLILEDAAHQEQQKEHACGFLHKGE